MSTLVIITHPDIDNSTVNKAWKEKLANSGELATIHELYATYPDGKIDIAKEQERLAAHDNVVFQFPLYWYSYPPLLKQYFDEVFTYGWAYGSTGNALKDEDFAAAGSIGSPESAYTTEGNVQYTIDTLLSPLKATARFVGAQYVATHKLYSTLNIDSELLEANQQDYATFVQQLSE